MMRASAISKFIIIGVALLKLSSASILPSRQQIRDDVLDIFDEEEFYEEEPQFNKRVIDLVDDAASTFQEAFALVQRDPQQAAAGSTTNTSGAGGIPSTQSQTESTLAVTNDTANSSTGTSSGYIGLTPNANPGLVNCSDPINTGLSNTCWAELHLSDYVQNWTNTHTCVPSEGFANCFLRQAGYPGKDCSVMNHNRCTDPEWIRQNTAEMWYVVYNIFSINNFFTNWGDAVTAGASSASWNIAQIIQIINPPPKTPVIMQQVLIAFQSIFALVPGPLGIWAAHGATSFGFQTAAQVVSNALGTAPNIGRYLFPTDTANAQIVQIGELGANFATIIQGVQGNLNKTLNSVMANSTEFLAFAEQGNFSAGVSSLPSLVDQSNYLYYAFNTYLISQALNGNNVYATIGRGTNVAQFKANGTQLNYDNEEIKCDSYNELNICDTWWYSENYQSSFALNDFSHMNKNWNKEMNRLFANMTTGQLLFEAAYACNSQGNFGQPINITVNAGGINTACISQLKVLTWDMTCHNPDMPSSAKNCEFLEATAQPTFWYRNGRRQGAPYFSVPASYLGPALTRTSPLLQRT